MKRLSPIAYAALVLVACSEDPEAPPVAPGKEPAQTEQSSDQGHQGSNLEADQAPVMRVEGRKLLDSSGKPVVLRGIEGWFGPNGEMNMEGLVDAIASQGFNALRLQTMTNDIRKIEPLIRYAHSKGMVYFLNDDHMDCVRQERFDDYLGREDVQAMVERNRHNMIIDVTIEEPEDAQGGKTSEENDQIVANWVQAQKDSIAQVRAWGYKQPLIIGTLNHGRYLRGLIDHGAEIIASDPENNIILNAQMYWGDYDGDFSYQGLSNYSEGDVGIREAAKEVSEQPFIIQWGIDASDDGGGDAEVPYGLLMEEAERYGIGTLFWEWKDPDEGDANSLVTESDNANSLTPLGEVVINTHAASIKKTAHPVTDFPPSAPIPEGSGVPSECPYNPDEDEPDSTDPEDPADSTDDDDTESGASCADVPEKFRGKGDGCDCPADGDQSCDTDCNSGNLASADCGCEYCYVPGSEDAPAERDDMSSEDDTSTTEPHESTADDTTDTTSIDDSTRDDDTDTSDLVDDDTDPTDTEDTSTDTEERTNDDDSDDETSDTDSDDSSTTDEPPPPATTTSSPPDEPPPDDEGDDDDGMSSLPESCQEVPEEYRGIGDGCDCPLDGTQACDPDCEDGNTAEGDCGCEFCHPGAEVTSDDDSTETGDEPLMCEEIPLEFIGIGDGCDCAADGDERCDPDCEDGNTAEGDCGCQFCHPQE